MTEPVRKDSLHTAETPPPARKRGGSHGRPLAVRVAAAKKAARTREARRRMVPA